MEYLHDVFKRGLHLMSINNKIVSFFIRHPGYFRQLISAHYSFDYLGLMKYHESLDWSRISENTAIKWNDQILTTFSRPLEWQLFSHNPSTFQDINLIQQFVAEIHWVAVQKTFGFTIASNTGVPWTMELIDIYESKLDFAELSSNESLPWSEYLIDKYNDRWIRELLVANESLPWSISFFDKYFTPNDISDFWFGLNESISGVFEIVEKYHSYMDWNSICSSQKLPWQGKNLLSLWDSFINWHGIARNEYFFTDQSFFENHLDRWYANSNNAFHGLSCNKALHWSVEFIEQYLDLWHWDRLSLNHGLPWSIELIDRFKDAFIWGGIMVEIEADPNHSKEPLINKLLIQGLVTNEALPWSIEFLEYYEKEIDLEMLGYNDAVWEKAFKPFVDEELIDTVISNLLFL